MQEKSPKLYQYIQSQGLARKANTPRNQDSSRNGARKNMFAQKINHEKIRTVHIEKVLSGKSDERTRASIGSHL